MTEEPTPYLRFVSRVLPVTTELFGIVGTKEQRILQQLWHTDKGTDEWRDVVIESGHPLDEGKAL